VAPNVIAELKANRALALACAKQTDKAIQTAHEAERLSAAAEPRLISRLALSITALVSPGTGVNQVDETLTAVSRATYIDALVTAYRGHPALLPAVAGRDSFHSELTSIISQANDERLAQRMLPAFATRVRQDTLSAREKEVLSLVAQGMRNRDIAEQLFISEVTVKAHMRSIMRKLGARSRTHAVSLSEALN
jgi:DNA-binding CsgD family transcriptional regulator